MIYTKTCWICGKKEHSKIAGQFKSNCYGNRCSKECIEKAKKAHEEHLKEMAEYRRQTLGDFE